MKKILMYLKQRRFFIMVFIVLTVLQIVVLSLYRCRIDSIKYCVELEITVFVVFMAFDYYVFKNKKEKIDKCLNAEKIYEFERDNFLTPIEENYAEIIEKLIMQQASDTDKYISSMSELKDYYAIWAHQIKTPIAAMDLTLQVLEENPECLDVHKLKNELFKIDFYTDAVMNYLRLEDMSSDYTFENYNLGEIANKAVRKFSMQFILKKISVNVDCKNISVYTDEKWVGFIIEQLLSNCINILRQVVK